MGQVIRTNKMISLKRNLKSLNQQIFIFRCREKHQNENVFFYSATAQYCGKRIIAVFFTDFRYNISRLRTTKTRICRIDTRSLQN